MVERSSAGPAWRGRWAERIDGLMVGGRSERLAWVPFALALAVITGLQVQSVGWRFSRWDSLQVSGFATLVAGLVLAQQAPDRLHLTLERLADRHVLVVKGGDLDVVTAELEARARRWARTAAVIVAVAIFVSFAVAFSTDRLTHSFLVPAEVVGGFTAGYVLGRLASYGRLGAVLRDTECTLNPRPDHLDQAAGLKPIGDFYFFEALVASIPALFLAAWWFLIPLYGRRYAHWRRPYVGLLALAIIFEVLVFLVPMVWFHQQMVVSKRNFLREADQLSHRYDELSAKHKAPAEKDEAAAAAERYAALEAMPTWPVDAKTRLRFRLNNLALLLPIIGSALGNTELGKQVSDFLRSITS